MDAVDFNNLSGSLVAQRVRGGLQTDHGEIGTGEKGRSKFRPLSRAARLPNLESSIMSTESESRRAAAVSRLEALHHESEIELLYMWQAVDARGEPVGKSVVSNTWPPNEEWPGDECLSLWRESCDLVSAQFDADAADGGLSAWLFSHTQQFWSHTGIGAVVNDPFRVWVDAMRNPNQGESCVACAMIVTSNPLMARSMDLLAISDKAQIVAKLLREQHNENEKLRQRIDSHRSYLLRRSEHSTESNEMFAADLKVQCRTLREYERTWRHWTGYADIVSHYASALLPDELAKCREMSRRAWQRPQEANWDELERELDLMANRFQWLPAPIIPEKALPTVRPNEVRHFDQAQEMPAGGDNTGGESSVNRLPESANKAGESDLTLMERCPDTLDGHLRFLEFVSDEAEKLAEYLRKEPNAWQTVKHHVEGRTSAGRDFMNWSEARERVRRMRDAFPVEVRRVEDVLQNTFTVDTLEQLAIRLKPAVLSLRNAITEHRMRLTIQVDGQPSVPASNPPAPKPTLSPAKATESSSAGGPSPSDDVAETVRRVALLLGADGPKLLDIVTSKKLKCDQMLFALGREDERFKGYGSPELAELTRFKEQTIRNTSTWRKWHPLPEAVTKRSRK